MSGVILTLGASSITWKYAEKCEELSFVQAERTSLIQELENTKLEAEAELKSKNNTLDEYRRKMDKQGAEMGRLQAIEKAHKECPTQEELEQSRLAPSRGEVKRGTPIEMTLTFYGDGADENGGYAGITASGESLTPGMVASNAYPFGTKFSFNGQIFTVKDRGGSHFNSSNRLDVYVPRKSGESNSDYKKRLMQYGRRTVTMYKL